jgi:hypothetical protein
MIMQAKSKRAGERLQMVRSLLQHFGEAVNASREISSPTCKTRRELRRPRLSTIMIDFFFFPYYGVREQHALLHPDVRG